MLKFSESFSVLIRENGKLLGRLTPDGHATRNVIFAAAMTRETADRVAADINEAGTFTAKVIKF